MVTNMVSDRLHDSAAGGPLAFAADQPRVWAEIDSRQARAGSCSPTAALHDLYAREADALDAFRRAFPCPTSARGVAIGLFDRLLSVDLFDSAETFERQWPRLVESAASVLLDQRRAIAAGVAPKPRHEHLDSGALARMLARARAAVREAQVRPSVGQGSDVRFGGPKLVGSALVHRRRAIHVSLFRG